MLTDRLQTSTNDRSNSPTPNNARSSLPTSDHAVNSQFVRDTFLQMPIYARSGLLGQFAAEFLMPECFIDAWDEEDDLIERFGVSWDAAHNRLRYLHKNGRF